MNLLSSLAALAGGSQGGGMAALLPVLLEQVKKYPGGLNGLIESFQRGGLGEVVASWISTGPNLPVSADQLRGVLGSNMVEEIAKESGQDANSVLDLLTTLLPKAIDKISPDGQLPKGGIDTGTILSLLASFATSQR